MRKKRITKRKFLPGFIAVTMILALVRCIFPQIAETPQQDGIKEEENGMTEEELKQELAEIDRHIDSITDNNTGKESGRFFDGKHPILSVPSYKEEFPDSNALQLTAAEHFGVSPVSNRLDAEQRKNDLVYIGSNPYFFVKELTASIPYLIPRASILLQDIGKNFFDSLQVKQIPLHKIIVTSVLRSKEDVAKLRTHNRNATENSCHLYGTTFDISYTKFVTVSNPDALPRREVQNDTLKFVLSEVLRDLRNQQRCYVKYEVKQSCYHITVR